MPTMELTFESLPSGIFAHRRAAFVKAVRVEAMARTTAPTTTHTTTLSLAVETADDTPIKEGVIIIKGPRGQGLVTSGSRHVPTLQKGSYINIT